MNTHFNVSDQELAAATGGVDLSELFKSMLRRPSKAEETQRVIHLTPQQQESLNQHFKTFAGTFEGQISNQ